MYRLQESFEEERKISNFALFGMVCIYFALHGMVCIYFALHGMFWESMVDLGCGLQPFLLIGAETGSGFFRSRQDTT